MSLVPSDFVPPSDLETRERRDFTREVGRILDDAGWGPAELRATMSPDTQRVTLTVRSGDRKVSVTADEWSGILSELKKALETELRHEPEDR